MTMTTTTDQRFTPDWLTAPLDEARLVACEAAWARWSDRWLRVAAGGGLSALALMGVAVAMTAMNGSTLHVSWAILACSLAAVVMTIPAVMVQAGQSVSHGLQPLGEQHLAEFRWLLEHTVAAGTLRPFLGTSSRSPRHGELDALKAAYATQQRDTAVGILPAAGRA